MLLVAGCDASQLYLQAIEIGYDADLLDHKREAQDSDKVETDRY